MMMMAVIVKMMMMNMIMMGHCLMRMKLKLHQNHAYEYEEVGLPIMTDGLRKSHLKMAHQVGLEGGLPDYTDDHGGDDDNT